MPLAPSWVPQNMLPLDDHTLVVVVVDTDPSGTEATVEDLVGVELDGASYTRGTADAEVARIDDAWHLFATGASTFDLSDSAARAGVWLATDGDTDADRELIFYSPDPAAPDPAWTPSWPSGVYDLPIESIDDVLADHESRIEVLESAPGSGVQSVVAGANVTVDNTDPANPVVSATGGGSGWTLEVNGNLGVHTDGTVAIFAVYAGSAGPIDTPTLVGTTPAGCRPGDPQTRRISWHGGGMDFGDAAVVIDDDAGTTTSTPGGVMVMDLTGTLTDTDDVKPLLAGVTWLVEQQS